jgi:hypothetical protein
MTGQDIFNMAIDFMCKRDVSGVIDPTRIERYRVRAVSVINAFLKTLAYLTDLYKTYSFVCLPYKNKLGEKGIVRYEGTDLTYECDGLCYAYSFCADTLGNNAMAGVVYIEDYTTVWNTLATVDIYPTTTITNYNGTITPTVDATKTRIRISSGAGFGDSCIYIVYNMALFDVKMQDLQVPEYADYIRHEMPDDFKSIDQLVQEADGTYKDGIYRWENGKDLYINKDFEGLIRIVYRPMPDSITALSNDIDIDDTMAVAAAYNAAAHFLLIEEPEMASYFEQKAQEIMAITVKPKPARPVTITDVY